MAAYTTKGWLVIGTCRKFTLFTNKLTFKKDILFVPISFSNQADCLVNFELFYTNICNLGVLPVGDLDFKKTKIKNIALTVFFLHL